MIERSQLAHLLQLVAKISKSEITVAKLAFELGSLFLIDGLLGAFDQGEHVAHAQHARDDALRVDRLERVLFLAYAQKLHRRARHFTDGKRRATTRVAVELGQDDAGQAEPAMEFAGRAHRVLSDHGVGDEQDFSGLQVALEMAEFAHQFIVDMQAPRRVNEDYIRGGKLGFADGALSDFQGFIGARARPKAHAHRFGHLCKLLAGRGPINVGGNDQRPVAMASQPFAKLSRGSGFARTLQSDDHPYGRRPRGKSALGMLAKQLEQCAAHNFEDLLIGRELQQDLRAQGFGADMGEQFVGNVYVDVAIEQGFANSTQRGVQVLLGKLALAAQVLEDALKFLCKVLKHDCDSRFILGDAYIAVN